MITLTLKSSKEEHLLKLPTCVEEITLWQFCRYMQVLDKSDLHKLSVLSGLPLDVLERCDYDSVMMKASIALSEINFADLDTLYAKPKEKIVIDGRMVRINYHLDKQVNGQYFGAQDYRKMYSDPENPIKEILSWPYVIALYTQPSFDAGDDEKSQWYAQRGQGFNGERAVWFAETYIKHIPIADLYGTALFFYQNSMMKLQSSVNSLKERLTRYKSRQASKSTPKRGGTSPRRSQSRKKRT